MRVVLVRAGALGDLLLLRPALLALKRAGHRVSLIAPERPAAVLLGEVDRLFPWERPELAALLAGAPPEPPLRELLVTSDRIVAYTRSEELLRALHATGTPLRAHDPSPPEGRHAADWFADAVKDLAAAPPGVPPPLLASAQERLEADRLCASLEPGFLALHPGSGSAAKNWPPERFRVLLDELGPARSCLVVRGPADAAACAGLVNDPRAVWAVELPLRVLGASLARAGVFVGNDSGVSHLAAAFGARTLALFGPTDSRTWRPLGSSVRTLSSRTRKMEGLAVAEVVAAARGLWALREAGSSTSARALPSG